MVDRGRMTTQACIDDYTHGQLNELIEVTISSKARLFVSAVGIPPAHTIKRLHEAGILIMNMVGHPKHAHKALKAGVDIVCAQGGEGGGESMRAVAFGERGLISSVVN